MTEAGGQSLDQRLTAGQAHQGTNGENGNDLPQGGLEGQGDFDCRIAGNTTAALVDPRTAPMREASSQDRCSVNLTTAATSPKVSE